MNLTDRIAARNRCAVVDCQRTRQRDSLFCRSHLDEMWLNRLVRQPDGSYLPVRFVRVRDMTGVA